MDVGMAMPGLRQAVNDHRRLRRRLEALPWERDSELGRKVLERMRRPEALADLAQDLPQLARQLAASPPDPNAPTWRAWRPKSLPDVALPSEAAAVEQARPPSEPDRLAEATLPDVDAVEGAGAVDEDASLDDEAPVDEEEQEPPQALPVEPEPAPHTKQASTAPMGGGEEDLRPALLSLLTRMGIEAPEPMDARSVRRRLGPHVQEQPKDMRLTRLLRLALRLTPDALDQATAVQKELMTELGGMVDALDAWTKLRLQARHLPNGHGLLKDALVLGEALDRIPGPGRRLPLGEDDHELPSSGSEEELRAEVVRLGRAINLPSAGGIR